MDHDLTDAEHTMLLAVQKIAVYFNEVTHGAWEPVIQIVNEMLDSRNLPWGT